MNKTFFLVITFLISINQLLTYEHELAICTVFRDEREYVREWVEFHIKQGVEHFYLYDNFSIDHPEEELKDYIDQGIVEIIPWHVTHGTHESFVNVQNKAFLDCFSKTKHQVKWCACIDMDEFLFCPDGKNLKVFLKDFEDYQCLCVEWLLYGTSHIQKVPKGELTKNLFYRVKDNLCVAYKCIVKPKKVTGCHYCHYFLVEDQSLCVDENKQFAPLENSLKGNNAFQKIRINHYFCRDVEYLKTKIQKAILAGRDPQILIEQEKLCNEVFDATILDSL